MRYYSGVYKFAPIVGLQVDFGWLSCKYRICLCMMMRFWNRLDAMNDNRLNKRVFMFDYHKCLNNWSSEIQSICLVCKRDAH